MPKILLVDDDKLICEMLRAMLEQKDYATELASDGDEAIRMFHKFKPDLVVTDIILPEKEGIEIIQQFLRENPAVKILAISGGALNIDSNSTLKMAKALGAHATLSKPLFKDELLTTVQMLLYE